MLSENDLIVECIKGNRQAQKQLYEQYSPLMFAICLRYMDNRATAEDALITGFTAIFSKINTFEYKGSFEGWMKRIMVNNAISLLRANNKYATLYDDNTTVQNVKFEHESIINKLNAKDLIAIIAQLPTGYRTIFNMFAIEGYSYEEIAQQLDISIGTVRSQLSKARKVLQHKLKNYYE